MGKIPELYNKKDNCCGCSACYSICPKDAISMVADEEGFLYPRIDRDICIGCRKCISVCQLKMDQQDKVNADVNDSKCSNDCYFETTTYAVRIKDKEILERSSSGGAFTAISNWVLDNDGAIICSSYNYSKHTMEFRLITTPEERELAYGSKYVQSEPKDIFEVACSWLKNNPSKWCMFIGTGCQSAGFSKYIERNGREYRKRVVIVDIICHGVPSPLIWREYIGLLTQNKRTVGYVSFKDKRRGWKKPTAIAVIDGKEVSLKPYVKIFYRNEMIRPSCYKCPYASVERDHVDITIGDYWGVEKTYPDFYSKMGNSLLIVHSQTGANIFESIKENIEYKQCSVKECLQPNLCSSTDMPINRQQIWDEYFKYGIAWLVKKYGTESFIEKLKHKVILLLPLPFV